MRRMILFTLFGFALGFSVNGLAEQKFLFSITKKNKEMTKATARLKTKGFFENVIYMNAPSPETKFLNAVKNGDIVEVHGDGLPWIAGGDKYDDNVDVNPVTLAQYFSRLLRDKKDISLTIDLHFCTSGTEAVGKFGKFRFAEYLSKALKVYGFPKVTVWGYLGYLTGKDILKQSVIGDKASSKGAHCPLEQAKIIFQDGELLNKDLLESGKKPLPTLDYDEYIAAKGGDSHKSSVLKFQEDANRIGLRFRD